MRLRRGIVQKSSFRNNLSSAGAISQRIIPVHLNPIRAIVVPSFRLLYNFPQQPLAFQRNLRDSTRSTKKRVKINKRLIFTIFCTTTYVTPPSGLQSILLPFQVIKQYDPEIFPALSSLISTTNVEYGLLCTATSSLIDQTPAND